MVVKDYEIRGKDRCVMSTTYMGVRVNLEFKGGDTMSKKDGYLSTSNPFVQAAIESMPMYGKTIVLKSTYNIEPTPKQEDKVEADPKVKKAVAKKKVIDGKESFVVYEVKNINDAASYFMEKGVTVESKEQLDELMQKYNVVFPNMK